MFYKILKKKLENILKKKVIRKNIKINIKNFKHSKNIN